MKKLFIFSVLFFLAASVFCEPKVPKYYFGDSNNKDDAYSYISNDLMYCYEIQAVNTDTPNFKYKLNFEKYSLIDNSSIYLCLFFKTENQLDNFIKDIHLSDIENEFIRIRKQIINTDGKPKYISNKPSVVRYEVDGTKL